MCSKYRSCPEELIDIARIMMKILPRARGEREREREKEKSNVKFFSWVTSEATKLERGNPERARSTSLCRRSLNSKEQRGP
jgi:hypothetical protein